MKSKVTGNAKLWEETLQKIKKKQGQGGGGLVLGDKGFYTTPDPLILGMEQ